MHCLSQQIMSLLCVCAGNALAAGAGGRGWRGGESSWAGWSTGAICKLDLWGRKAPGKVRYSSAEKDHSCSHRGPGTPATSQDNAPAQPTERTPGGSHGRCARRVWPARGRKREARALPALPKPRDTPPAAHAAPPPAPAARPGSMALLPAQLSQRFSLHQGQPMRAQHMLRGRAALLQPPEESRCRRQLFGRAGWRRLLRR